jgi:hypothetical protein
MTEEPYIPRIPSDIWKELRRELKRLGEGFNMEKNAEACAMTIQRLQHEFTASKKFHIGIVPEPGKILLTI